jgi:hypothetical protein
VILILKREVSQVVKCPIVDYFFVNDDKTVHNEENTDDIEDDIKSDL